MRIMGLALASLAGLWFIGAPLAGVTPLTGATWSASAWAADTSAAVAGAQPGAQALGEFGDWQAKTVSQQGVTLCYISSAPTNDSPAFTGRGSTGLLVTHAQHGVARDQVSVALGFAPRKGTSVSLKIGKRSFTLQKIQGERAWSSSDAQDRQIVAAMKKADTLLLRATTTKGRTGEDRYSLSGFTTAYNKIADACGL
jgi:invasion protein IalB